MRCYALPMPRPLSDQFDVLFVALDASEGELAREILAEAGIPSMLFGPDFDMAELGAAAHAAVRRNDLYVPKGARTAARAAMVEAWGEQGVAAKEPR
jgi:hypothetical protein